VCTIEDVQRAYPLLDMVDHEHRNAVATGSHPDDTSFPPVEGKHSIIVLLFTCRFASIYFLVITEISVFLSAMFPLLYKSVCLVVL
jgi:hypothetical protein